MMHDVAVIAKFLERMEAPHVCLLRYWRDS